MLDSLITSKTRLKLLLKLFLNPEISAHLRGLSSEFGESSNAIRVELNRLTEAGLLESHKEGRTVAYQANQSHKLFPDINSIVRKYMGLDEIVEGLVNQLGDVELALITGDYARGVDSGLIDLVVVGNVDQSLLNELVKKSEAIIGRKIRAMDLDVQEFEGLKARFASEPSLVVWGGEPVEQRNSKGTS